jgi:hypothetical protein
MGKGYGKTTLHILNGKFTRANNGAVENCHSEIQEDVKEEDPASKTDIMSVPFLGIPLSV